MHGLLSAVIGLITALFSSLIGATSDSASTTGTVLARLKHLTTMIGSSSDGRGSNTVMGWLNSPIKSMQMGTIAIGSGYGTAQVSITTVNASKSLLLMTGYTSNYAPTSYTAGDVPGIYFLNTGSCSYVNANRTGTGGTTTVYFMIIEFY